MISHDLKMRTVKQIMIELRADGPCTKGQLRYAVLDQVPGITRENLEEVFTWAFEFVTLGPPGQRRNKRLAMATVYDEDATGSDLSWVVSDRMYDHQGNYLGDHD